MAVTRGVRSVLLGFIAGATLFAGLNAQAAIQHVRWEQQFGLSGQIQPILRQLNQTAGFPQLTAADFKEVENKTLANYRFVTLLQLSQGVPVKGAMIRTWESLADGHLVLMEAHIDNGAQAPARAANMSKNSVTSHNLSSVIKKIDAMKIAKSRVLSTKADRKIVRVKSEDQWNGSDLEKVITVTGRRGVHVITVSTLTGKVKSQTFEHFPQADIQASVYPIYEETDKTHEIQPRVQAALKNLNAYRRDVQGDPYALLKSRHYYDSLADDILGNSIEGQAQGFWSMTALKQSMASTINNLPVLANSFETGGVFLEGKYATINLHPDVQKMSGLTSPLRISERALFDWQETTRNGNPDYELSIVSSFKSRPLVDANDALSRPARRLPNHDVVSYINDGFDEVQVYYAIDTLMSSLHAMGFTDPELSTRPFNAFLFNPDIEYKDNAYYTDDTINFTTYSPTAPNYARDNSTIWHELGHGVMDRLMGDRIKLADTGGLSEGMADFVAQLVIQDVTKGQPFAGQDDFRIVNSIGFSLTNESHDDGEAYGGSMRDFMMNVYAKQGAAGLAKVADITMDAMRLARNHPALTANDWFESILFADQLGRAGLRAPGEMHDLIQQALAKRNFRFDRGAIGEMIVKADGNVVTAASPGSRYNPIIHQLAAGATASHDITVSLKSSDTYSFKYPVTIEASFNGGPLQGAVKWANEAAGPLKVVLNSEADVATLKVAALSGCDEVNREDGSCQDFAYIKVINAGETQPVAKKRFYLRIAGETAAKVTPATKAAARKVSRF